MKRVLILGANPETVSLIEKANSMGLYTIVTDYDPNAYAKRFASKAYNVNAIDVEALVELAKTEQVDGVLVGVAEALLPTYCEVCKRLGFPCYATPELFEIMVRKDSFKEQCRIYGVPTIEEYTMEQMEEMQYPVIVKPVDSCSSKGITICYNKEELLKGIEYALSFSKSGKYLIETYMTGDEVISYYVIQEGNPIFVGMCDRYTHKEKERLVQLPTAYIFPSRHIDNYLKETDEKVKNMLRGLGLQNGSIFFQAFTDENGICRIYEPGFRLNGAQEHIIISKVSGIDAKELYINLALTGKVAEEDISVYSNPKPKQISCKLSPLVMVGEIGKLQGLDEIAKLPDVVSVNASYCEGDTVTGEGTLKQIVCRFFIVSKNKRDLMNTIQEIYRFLRVEDKQGNNMLMKEFDIKIVDERYE